MVVTGTFPLNIWIVDDNNFPITLLELVFRNTL